MPKCSECYGEVPIGAKKCMHCSSKIKLPINKFQKICAIILGVIIIFALITIFTGSEETNSPKIDYPYEFVQSKTETAGNNKNKMDLYAYSGNINLDNLKTFCREHKNKFTSGTFYHLVIFDSKDNAAFPKDPITAAYALEEKPQKHIRAFYIYNRLNGYSKLDYYDKNKWESVAKTENI